MRRICVYAGSSFGSAREYESAAGAFGGECARRGLGIVYGGGRVGLMGAMADAALAAGGEVIGVIPRAMVAEERAHQKLTELIVVETMHERKRRIAEFGDAFAALPGGIGTLEELVEIYTWLQLGLHLKPVGLLNVGGFYDPLLGFLDRMREAGFLTAAHRSMLAVERDGGALLDRLASTMHVAVPKPIYPTEPKDSARGGGAH